MIPLTINDQVKVKPWGKWNHPLSHWETTFSTNKNIRRRLSPKGNLWPKEGTYSPSSWHLEVPLSTYPNDPRTGIIALFSQVILHHRLILIWSGLTWQKYPLTRNNSLGSPLTSFQISSWIKVSQWLRSRCTSSCSPSCLVPLSRISHIWRIKWLSQGQD